MDERLTKPPIVGLTTILCASPNQVSSRVGEEAAILDLDSSVYFGLDSVGARVFELLQQPTRVDTVLGQVVEEYEVDEDTARGDLLALLGDLIDNRLVEVRGSDAP